MAFDIKKITSNTNPVIKKIRSLGLKKYRDEHQLFIAEGLRHVTEALNAGWKLDILAFAPKALEHKLTQSAIAAAEQQQVLCLEVTADLLAKITSRDNAQPVIGVFHQHWHDPDIITAQDGDLWIGLENIRDPGNLGTIIRTADCVGANGILLIGKTCDPYSVEAIRASMGSFAQMKLIRLSEDNFFNWRTGFSGTVTGTHLRTDTDYRKADYSGAQLLVMGNEQAGISDAMAKTCTQLVKIPMTGKADSLNLAVSTGIMLYEMKRAVL